MTAECSTWLSNRRIDRYSIYIYVATYQWTVWSPSGPALLCTPPLNLEHFSMNQILFAAPCCLWTFLILSTPSKFDGKSARPDEKEGEENYVSPNVALLKFIS